MAVAPTGAIFKALSFDGESSRSYGVYITGEAVFNAPERDVEMVTIPGRNGALALDNGRFENIEVSYQAGIFANDEEGFAKAVSDFRNFLCSRKGYCRLSDEYNPDEYRMAIYKSGLDVTPANLKAGQFTITFDCKPQRWLTSGEEAVDVSDWSNIKTISGDVVEIDADSGTGIKSASSDFEYEQNVEPWASEVESVPYLYRPSSGRAVTHGYDKETGNIIGATVNWNQMASPSSFPRVEDSFTNGIKVSAVDILKGEITITVDAGGATALRAIYMDIHGIPENHIRLNKSVMGDGSLSTYAVNLYNNYAGTGAWDIGKGSISKTSDYTNRLGLVIFSGCPAGTYKFRPQVIDLTALFGSATIADYVYSLETATAGAGVAWLKSHGFIDGAYHAYDTGTLKSVEGLLSHDTVGFNQWDEEWEVIGSGEYARLWSKNYIPVLPNTEYYFYQETPNNLKGHFYDADKNVISEPNIYRNRTFSTPENARYMKFNEFSEYGLTYNNDICINLSDPSRDGEYEPYKRNSYPLDSSVTLRGLFKLDANNNLYADGDVYPPSGDVTRKYKQLVLNGSENWQVAPVQNALNNCFVLQILDTVQLQNNSAGSINGNIRSSTYESPNVIPTADNRANKILLAGNDDVMFINIGWTSGMASDVNAFKSYLSANPVTVIYELATPTTEQADPYQALQIVDKWGTEEFVVDSSVSVPIPVGHQTKYHEEAEIVGTTEVSVYVSPTDSEEDATEYSTALGGTYASGTLDIVSGKLTIDKGYISSYNGETINEPWVSSLDPYVSGTTPSMGAQVVYPLTTPTIITLTGKEIQTLLGKNYIWSSLGNISIEYGDKPGFLTNPTLFDSNPLLKLRGYGTLNVGDYELEFSGPIGRFPIRFTRDGLTLTMESFDISQLTSGDSISIGEISATIFLNGGTSGRGTCEIISGPTGSYCSTGYGYDGSNYYVTCDAGLYDYNFTYGTPSQATVVARYIIPWKNESSETFDCTVTFAYDGDKTITVTATSGSAKSILGTLLYASDIYGEATGHYEGDIYCDCEIGEVYGIEDGQITNLNSLVSLGSDLPKLSVGSTEITYDNTITDLEITPRWWKV